MLVKVAKNGIDLILKWLSAVMHATSIFFLSFVKLKPRIGVRKCK